jgi:hypothetical protein
MARQITDQQTDAHHSRRESNDYRTFLRNIRREDDAAEMIGELASGKFYVWPAGGKYREGTRSDLIAFLLRNNYA